MNSISDLSRRLHARNADYIIRDARVWTPAGPERTDIACLGGKIVSMNAGNWQARDIVNAKGLQVIPGVIDSQVHFRDPGLTHKEDIEAGTRGAVLGGVTSIFEMPNTDPLTLTQADIDNKLRNSVGRAWCDHAFYVGGSSANIDQLEVLERLPGCAGIKVFMGSSFGALLASEDEMLRDILRSGRRRMAIHAEDDARLKERKYIAEEAGHVRAHPLWRDEKSALQATRRIVSMAREFQRRLHILHISTAEEMAYLSAHKDIATIEVLPHHLTLSAPECYERLGTLAQMNPPVRSTEHRDALWRAVDDGLVDVIGSDHAPHTLQEKSKPYPTSPSGMPGVQTLLPVMLNHLHQGRISLQRLIELTSTGPARVFGIQSKGRIALGYDADLTFVDLHATRTIQNQWIASKSAWSPYDGMKIVGWPVATMLRGEFVVRDEQLIGAPFGVPVKFFEGDQAKTVEQSARMIS